MTTALSQISVNSLPFFTMALGLVWLSWSRWNDKFLYAFAAASALVVASWSTPLDVLALALFLGPPLAVTRVAWGNAAFRAARAITSLVTWEVLLFIYLRKYEWAGELAWLDHPIAVIGLSYMLFRTIHLLVDAPKMGKLPFSLLHYATYMIAFWTVLSGPIQRYEAFCTGLEKVGKPTNADVLAAGHRAMNGLFKAFLIAPVFLKASDLQALTAPSADWLDFAIVFYSYPIYIYLNFSGYTDFMIGIARLCGVTTLPENFNRPYLARNLLDFWSRWHISFGAWIRTYVFTPLSTALVRRTSPKVHTAMLAFSIVTTFLVVGAWHGTSLNFIVFGVLHAGGILVTGLYDQILKNTLNRNARRAWHNNPVVHGASVFICFHYVAATILLFPNSTGDLIEALSQFRGNV